MIQQRQSEIDGVQTTLCRKRINAHSHTQHDEDHDEHEERPRHQRLLVRILSTEQEVPNRHEEDD